MVFSGLYPINTADYEHLKANLGKLQLNDSAFVYQPESSVALGFGFRCGFLGLLHLEIVQERLRREYGMDIIATYPSVVYHVMMTDGTVKDDGQPGLPARSQLYRKNRGADGLRLRHLPQRIHRRHDGAAGRKARRGGPHRNPRPPPRHADQHAAAGGNSD